MWASPRKRMSNNDWKGKPMPQPKPDAHEPETTTTYRVQFRFIHPDSRPQDWEASTGPLPTLAEGKAELARKLREAVACLEYRLVKITTEVCDE